MDGELRHFEFPEPHIKVNVEGCIHGQNRQLCITTSKSKNLALQTLKVIVLSLRRVFNFTAPHGTVIWPADF